MNLNVICFQTRGEVNHLFGGLDRVTQVLASFFEDKGFIVYFLSQRKRLKKHDSRQHFLPNENILHCKENYVFYNQFIVNHNIQVLINQEANVDMRLPLEALDYRLVYLSVLHFAPNYITKDHFEYKFKGVRMPFRLEYLFLVLFRIPMIRNIGLHYLESRIRANYESHLSSSDCFVLLSKYFENEFRKLLKLDTLPDNVVAINNPLTIEPDFSHVFEKKKRLLYVGRLECRMKRVDELLRNWNSIAADFPDWDLQIVGDGPDRDYLKDLVSKLSIPRVIFERSQNPLRYFAEASIFCFSSSSEGWGLVLPEAMSCGCVPIAYDSYASIHDIITDNIDGVLVENHDSKAYQKELRKLMVNESLLAEMSKRSIAKAHTFDCDQIGEQWIELFNHLWINKYGEQ